MLNFGDYGAIERLHQQLTKPSSNTVFFRGTESLSWHLFSSKVNTWVKFWQSLPTAQWAFFEPNIENFSAALLAAWYTKQTLYISNDNLPTTMVHLSQWVNGFVGKFDNYSNTIELQNTHVIKTTPDLDNWGVDLCNLKNNTSSLIKLPLPLPNTQIFFLTSGSTGHPKPIAKNLIQLCTEINLLKHTFDHMVTQSDVYATVSHQHFFGFIFKLLWPLLDNRAIATETINFPEQLLALPAKRSILISSPAFLSRVFTGHAHPPLPLSAVFSAGSALSDTHREQIEKAWKTKVVEIYGSTETGAVAYKIPPHIPKFTPLESIQISLNTDGLLQLKAAQLDKPDAWYQTADKASVDEQQQFTLMGRSDRIFKLEEKRISLSQMETCLQQNPWVETAHIIPMTQNQRTVLGAVIVLTIAGRKAQMDMGRIQLIQAFKTYLKYSFEPLAIPRRWRFTSFIERDAQNKLHYQTLLNILESKP